MKKLLSLLLFLSLFAGLHAMQRPPSGEPATIHEAFVSPVESTPLLDAITTKPPEQIVERIPPQENPQAQWIPGYWEWIERKKDFAWVCGVWRVPPPGMIWNSGYWKQFPEGQVRIKGFWHRDPIERITAKQERPPLPIDEKVQSPPGKEYFWAPGFWQFSNMDNRYAWVPGRWEALDPKWVLTPGSYVWREEGYILVPPFWDYPIEGRGSAYCAQFVPPEKRSGYIHSPRLSMHPDMIIGQLFPLWPNHIGFFHHFWHFHPGFWDGWCCTPPWWGWDAWWGFAPHHMWDLWWWWGHPGFAFPWWMPGWMGDWVAAPGIFIIDILFGFGGPVFIGPWGPFPLLALLNAMEDVNGHKMPILPADPAAREKIFEKAPPKKPENGDQRPSGKPGGKAPEKPYIPTEGDVPRAPGGSAVPSKPKPPEQSSPIRKPQWQAPERPAPRPPVQTYPQPRPPVQVYPQPRPRPQPRPPVQVYPQPRPPVEVYPQPRPWPRPRPRPPVDNYPMPRPEIKPKWPWERPGRPQGETRPPSEIDHRPPSGETYPDYGPTRPQGEIKLRFPNARRRPQVRPEVMQRFQQLRPQQSQPRGEFYIK